MDLVLDALEQALRFRKESAGLIHHSIRGSQYAYQQLLKQHGRVLFNESEGKLLG